MLNKIRSLFGISLRAPKYADPPIGTFELIGDRCTIVVEDFFNPITKPLEIFVEHEKRVLRTFTVLSENKRGKYILSFNLDDTVTAVSLLHERLAIFVENAFGLRSQLKLDGPSQLMLIREHMGKPRELLFDLDLTAGGNAAKYLLNGWSSPEASFRWAEGPTASLLVPALTSRDSRFELTLNCRPFLVIPRVIDQTLKVTLNGYPQTILADSRSMGFFSSIYSLGSLNDDTSVKIVFDFPDCARPDDYNGKGDRRLLAFSFKQITFSRLLPNLGNK